ncbi:glycosyltransferase family 4 protein [Stenotrophomonas sp. CFBP 13718]|uniref:glycosyltransferase family 4 protein n=1 Tax=Stenotrophomonas sp. CFBP 13718 TaxID=2775304 RepID=UPI00177C115D|nr:glycosyltransferase family 4 protein [Stenotrophomonas sp. CFBP 13718]MBD8696067.1 glycosyltransferase family 4 protein [Stenotrophomonas sp. CFBP 13718]
MKALVVSNMYPSQASPEFGVFVRRITDQMSGGGIDVDLVVRTADGNKFFGYIRFYIRAFVATLFTKCDFVYLHFATHSFPPVALALLLRRLPLVVNVHGADIVPEDTTSELKSKILYLVASKALSRATLVVAPSQYFRQEIKDRFGYSLENIHVSPSGGVNTDRLKQSTMPGGRRRVLFLGRLIIGKGVAHIIPALSQLLERRPELDFEMIFGGEGPARKLLEQQAQSNSHLEVTLLGSIAPAQVPTLIQGCHGLVFPSYRRGESLGLVALESMACGRPVLAARSGAMSTIIRDGKNGYLFDPDDVDSLSRALERFLDLDNQELKSMSTAARLDSRDFDSHLVAKALCSTLRDIFGKPKE